MSWLISFFRNLFKPSSPAQKETQANPTLPGGPASPVPGVGGSTPTPPAPSAPISTHVPSDHMEVVQGLDVSHYEPAMDYTKAYQQGFRFVFAKATDGSGGLDAKYDYHRKNAKAVGMIFGSFHFIRFHSSLSAKEQAGKFWNTVGDAKGEMIAIDLEWDNSQGPSGKYADGKQMDDQAADFALELLAEVERLFGMKPILYTHHFFFTGFHNPERFARFPLWATQPNVDISKVVVPPPWKCWTFWQKTFHQKGLASQNPDGIDGDLFQGSMAELKALCKS